MQRHTAEPWTWVRTHRGSELRNPQGAAILMHEAGWDVSDADKALIESAPKLLAFAKAFIVLFRDSDMSPEDECHELFAAAREAVKAAEPGADGA